MLGLRFLGIRARLFLVVTAAVLAGGFALVPLLPEVMISQAYPRMALTVAVAAVAAAFLGRGITGPVDALRKVLSDRLQGRRVLPPPDGGHDELRWLSDVLGRYLQIQDAEASEEAPPTGVLVQGSRGLKSLLDLAAELPRAGGAAGALRRLLAGIREQLEVEHASLLLLNEAKGELELHAAAGLPDEVLAEIERRGPRPVSYAPGVGLAARALEEGRTQVAAQGARDEKFGRFGGAFERGVRSLVCVPLRWEDRTVGVLVAVNARRSVGFDAASVDFLERAALLAEPWLPGFTGGAEVGEDLDPLTGLLGAAAFHARLATEVERYRRRARGLAVAVLELAFPSEEPGGPARNDALAEVGGYLREIARGLDVAGRDGERFLLLLPETEVVGAIQTVSRIKERIDLAAVRAPGLPPRFAAVVGIASVPETVDAPERLLAAAEEALVAARRAGDHRLVCSSAISRAA